MKQLKKILMAFTALATILGIVRLQANIGAWTTLLAYLCLGIVFIIAANKSNRAWKWWGGSVICITYVLSFVASLTKVIHTEDGRIQIVSVLYPMVDKVILSGTDVNTIDVCYGYSTRGGSYKPDKGRLIAVRDTTCQLTTIIDGLGQVLLQGRQMQFGEYSCGEHGPINVTIFSYIDNNGAERRQDYYGSNPDSSTFSAHIRDDNDYYDYNL